MKVKILGSGTILSAKDRNPAGYLIETNSGYALLDCGPGILKQLNILDFDVLEINAVFISHFHLDHCSDVFPLLMRRYLLDQNINNDLKIYGPQNLKVWFNALASTQGSWLNNRPFLFEMSNSPIEWKNLKVSSKPNGHTENSISYRFDQQTKSFFFSSDMDFNQEIVDFAYGSDLAIMECSYPDDQPKNGHLTPGKLARFLKLAAIKQACVTHIYPENDTPDLEQRIKEHNVLQVEIGYDFKELIL